MNRASDLWCLTQHFSRQQNIEKYILTNSRLSNQTVESLNILKMTIFTCTLFHLRNANVAFGSANRTGIVYSYLPGTGDTLINKGVLPGRGLSIALRWADPCDRLKCRWLGCVISWWGGLRSRYPLQNKSMEEPRCYSCTIPWHLTSLLAYLHIFVPKFWISRFIVKDNMSRVH